MDSLIRQDFNMAKIEIKNNIKGKVDYSNLNYTYKDVDDGKLDPLFPEHSGKHYHGVKQNRVRVANKNELPERLPTADLMPYPIDEDDFIGEYESKKNIYLTLAHAFNKAMERIEQLEAEVAKLKK